jgi:flagellar L-ring protein precursor FlgH
MSRIMHPVPALVALLAFALGGCASAPEVVAGNYAPMLPVPVPAADPADGSVYSAGRQYSLFGDLRSRNVGDILTVRLVEQTQASKSASTDTSRSSELDTGNPTILGRNITQNGLPLLSNSIESDQAFAGSATSSQSNQLTGDITVTVAQVLENGNLVVRGEKWLTLNQGEEYIQISGIVRPADIAPDNSVASLRLADARIAYSGKGQVANSNRPGWLNRFFTSVLWPL